MKNPNVLPAVESERYREEREPDFPTHKHHPATNG